MNLKDIPKVLRQAVARGMVIPAQPLALDKNRQFDERRQRALTRYYIDAGAGGIAVGVHSTQFEIRDPEINLFEPVLRCAAETIADYGGRQGRPILKIAGICGRTRQALKEAALARQTGFHAGLLSLAALAKSDVPALVKHCREVSRIMPLIGFYLQPSVGGRVLPYEFWRRFAELDNVLAIKLAPFNRYQTFDVVRAVCEAGREKEIALYTGNDDHIVLDLLTQFKIRTAAGIKTARLVGGLLGHWCVWTRTAVELLDAVQRLIKARAPISPSWLTLAQEITDANAAIFDAAHNYAGCIPGLHEVLRRQGLLAGTWCLNPREVLSPGQAAEISRVYRAYPHLNDDAFVQANLHKWLA